MNILGYPERKLVDIDHSQWPTKQEAYQSAKIHLDSSFLDAEELDRLETRLLERWEELRNIEWWSFIIGFGAGFVVVSAIFDPNIRNLVKEISYTSTPFNGYILALGAGLTTSVVSFFEAYRAKSALIHVEGAFLAVAGKIIENYQALPNQTAEDSSATSAGAPTTRLDDGNIV